MAEKKLKAEFGKISDDTRSLLAQASEVGSPLEGITASADTHKRSVAGHVGKYSRAFSELSDASDRMVYEAIRDKVPIAPPRSYNGQKGDFVANINGAEVTFTYSGIEKPSRFDRIFRDEGDRNVVFDVSLRIGGETYQLPQLALDLPGDSRKANDDRFEEKVARHLHDVVGNVTTIVKSRSGDISELPFFESELVLEACRLLGSYSVAQRYRAVKGASNAQAGVTDIVNDFKEDLEAKRQELSTTAEELRVRAGEIEQELSTRVAEVDKTVGDYKDAKMQAIDETLARAQGEIEELRAQKRDEAEKYGLKKQQEVERDIMGSVRRRGNKELAEKRQEGEKIVRDAQRTKSQLEQEIVELKSEAERRKKEIEERRAGLPESQTYLLRQYEAAFEDYDPAGDDRDVNQKLRAEQSKEVYDALKSSKVELGAEDAASILNAFTSNVKQSGAGESFNAGDVKKITNAVTKLVRASSPEKVPGLIEEINVVGGSGERRVSVEEIENVLKAFIPNLDDYGTYDSYGRRKY
jgi:hypothetical protein